jgi:Secretion system C-terminal sorting domain
MKKNLLLILVAFFCTTALFSQNIITGSTMDDPAPWTNGGCAPEIALVDETAYGGPNSANNISEIDALTCMQQTVNINTAIVYTINFKATRRTTCLETPVNASMRVTVTGVTTNTVYSTAVYTYSNTVWTGYTNESQAYGIPGGAGDAQVRIDIVPVANPEGCGVILDDFTMQATGVLPVSLSVFNAAVKNQGVELSWTTSIESNSSYFSILRSKDGASFFEIGKVNAAGINSGASYNYTDATPGAGYNFYRLKQVDKNGVYKLSGIIRVNLNATDVNALVYPTVVSSVLNYVIESPKAIKLVVTVSDVTGKIISNGVQQFTSGTTQKSMNVSALAPGVYMLTVSDNENGGFKKSVKFSKN